MQRALVFAVLVLFFPLGPARAETVELTVTAAEPSLHFDQQGFTHIDVAGYLNLAKTGQPALPVKMIYVLLPPGHEFDSLQVLPGPSRLLPGRHVVVPAQAPRPDLAPAGRRLGEPDVSIYTSPGSLPGQAARAADMQWLRGFGIVPVQVWPVRYEPAQDRLHYSPRLTISVHSRPASRPVAGYRGQARDFARLQGLVANPEDLQNYAAAPPAPVPEECRYLIVTSEALTTCPGPNHLARLAADKQNRGLSACIETMAAIRAGYDGVDDAERLRNFIQDMHSQHGTDFVLLAGDADAAVVGGETEAPVVPMRKLWCQTDWWTKEIPSDLYFGCLDGDFDANGNGVWGEPDDEVDLFAEVWVGRAAVDNCQEINNLVRKTLAYQDAGGDYLRQVQLVGEWLWGGDTENWGGDYLERVHFSSDSAGFETLGFSEDPFFEVSTMYDRDLGGAGAWGVDDMLAVINGHPHIITHLGHALQNYSMRMFTDTALANMHNSEYFLELGQGCHSGAFDNQIYHTDGIYWQDSFAEHVTLGPHGAFAAVLNTRDGVGYYSNYLNRYFFDGLFRQGIHRLGELNAYSREQLAGYVDGYPFMRWVIYEITLFGDPELALHTEARATTAAIGLDREELHVQMAQADPAPTVAPLRIRNHGIGALSWSASSSRDWLRVQPAAGTTPQDLSLEIHAADFEPGSYRAELTVVNEQRPQDRHKLTLLLDVIEAPSILLPFAELSPEVDGKVEAGEYQNASVLDLDPQKPGSSIARLVHDGERMYLALELAADFDADSEDGLRLIVDREGDQAWPKTAGHDGAYRWQTDGQAWFSPWFVGDQGLEAASAVEITDSPHAFGIFDKGWVVEAALPLQDQHWQLSPGDRFGLALQFFDQIRGAVSFPRAHWPAHWQPADHCRACGQARLGTKNQLLYLRPDSLALQAVAGGAPSARAQIQLESSSHLPIEFTLSHSSSWLRMEPKQGTTPARIEVWADPSQEIAGQQSAILRVEAVADNSPRQVPVELVVLASQQEIEPYPGRLRGFGCAIQNGSVPARPGLIFGGLFLLGLLWRRVWRSIKSARFDKLSGFGY